MAVSSKKYFAKELVALTICADDAVVIVLLKFVEEKHVRSFVREFATATREKTLLVKEPRHLLDLATKYDTEFCRVVDADTVTASLQWPDASYNGYSLKVTGGVLCRRGSVIPSSGRPSEVAMQHEKLRAVLLHEFYRRNKEVLKTALVEEPKRYARKRKRLD